MRIRRIAILSAVTAAIGGAVLWKRSQSKALLEEEEDRVIELDSTPNGEATPEPEQQQEESRVPL